MSNLRQAAQQAIQAMKFAANPNEFAAVVADLEQALAEPEQPVAWRHKDAGHFTVNTLVSKFPEWEPLYTSAPTPRKPRHVSYVCPQCNWSLEVQE